MRGSLAIPGCTTWTNLRHRTRNDASVTGDKPRQGSVKATGIHAGAIVPTPTVN